MRRIAWLVLVVAVFGGIAFALLDTFGCGPTHAEIRQLVDRIAVDVKAEATVNMAAVQQQVSAKISADLETGDIVAPVTFNGVDPWTGAMVIAILYVMKSVPSSAFRLPVTVPVGFIRRRNGGGTARPPNGGAGPRSPPVEGSP